MSLLHTRAPLRTIRATDVGAPPSLRTTAPYQRSQWAVIEFQNLNFTFLCSRHLKGT